MYSSSAANFQATDIPADPLASAIERALDAGAPSLEIALAYCRHDIPVFPLSAETKRPYEKGGHHLATIDESTVQKWWLEWPGAAVGIPAGPPSGVWLMDLDERPGGSRPRLGITTLRNFRFEPFTVANCIVQTPSGGLHLGFRLSPGMHIPNRAGDIALGIDVRGTTPLNGSANDNNADRYTSRGYENYPDIVSGGYCVAAGSRRPDGRHYAFKRGSYLSAGPAPRPLLRLAVFNVNERSFIDGDAELQHRLEAAEPQQWARLYKERRAELVAETAVRPSHRSYCHVSSYARAGFEKALAELRAAREGQRDDTLWRAACSLMEFVKAGALRRAEVEGELRKAALSIGLEERIIVDKLRRAYEQVDPRDLSHVRGAHKQKARQGGSQTGGDDGGGPGPSSSKAGEEQAGSTAGSFGRPQNGANEDGDVEPADARPKPPNQLIDGVPGALGILAAHIRDIDPYSDEVRAVTIAIATIASLAGAGYECRNFNHTTCCDLFLGNLGGSGTGKTDLTKKAIKFAQEAVGKREDCPFQLLGGVASGEGLWDAVAASSAGGCSFATYAFDEFGDELGSMMARGSYKAGALTFIRQLTNAGDSVLSAPKLSQRSKAAPRSPIAYPVVSFLGIATARQFIEALGSGRMLENGIEARMLVLPSGETREFDVVSLPTPGDLILLCRRSGRRRAT